MTAGDTGVVFVGQEVISFPFDDLRTPAVATVQTNPLIKAARPNHGVASHSPGRHGHSWLVMWDRPGIFMA